MSKSYRIRTTPGDGNGYLKVNVDLNQNYDFLEILSLKISQKDEYQGFCADYGVIAGRVIVNGGFGVPNVKVSIFIPVEDSDLLDPVKSAIYNYTEPFPDQKNLNGIRYNLLPKNQQSNDHTPVGTFPKKREILDDSTTLEIYEKYYKYTTTTNEAGDYILFGVPVGEHILHYDMDVSDIGFLSTRPFELINKGYSEDLFESRFKYKSSSNIDSLPQIFSSNIPVTVQPYWCDSLKVGSELGINRLDIEPNVEIIPTSIFMGSIFSDDEKDSLNKNCKPSREMGKMNEVITGKGIIESLRRTSDGSIERFSFNQDSIDENGNWSVLVPMNLRKVVTDEFGNLIPSPDGVKGVATEGDYRFRISMDATSTDKRLRQRAKFLVPNTNNNFVFDEFSSDDMENTTLFTKNNELSTITVGTVYQNDLRNQYNYLEEFYPFRWKKVYTVKQYIGRMQKSRSDEARGFIGIKDIINAEGINKFPTNRFDTNINPIYTILCILFSIFGLIVGFINGIINIINGLITFLCNIKLPVGICVASFVGPKVRFNYYVWQFDGSNWNRKEYSIPGTGLSFPITYPGGWTGVLDDDTISDGEVDVRLGLNPTCKDMEDLFSYSTNLWAAMGSDPNKSDASSKFPISQGNFNGYCPSGAPTGSRFCYSDQTCYTSPYSGCRRWRLVGNSFNGACEDNNVIKGIDSAKKNNCQGVKILRRCWQLKYKCIFGNIFCKKCKSSCPEDQPHSCKKDAAICGDTADCCNDCCVKVPLIPLRCAEEDKKWVVTHIPSPFAASKCNKTFVLPFSCKTCGGLQTPGTKDWVSCVLEPVAVFLRMLKFDFYNDWVGGTLYFPLIKRKYKLKKSKRKFGQIKKDKFCDYECRIRDSADFQGNPTFKQWRIKIPNIIFSNPTINVQGCTAKIKGRRVTDWYGTQENDLQIDNLDLAVKEIKFNGTTPSLNSCVIEFDTFNDLENTLVNAGYNFSLVKSRKVTSEHGKPKYVETTDSNGFSTWDNIGGHGHHRNVCDNTRLMERKEFFKTSLDCLGGPIDPNDVPKDNTLGDDNGEFEQPESEEGPILPSDRCEGLDCNPSCSSNGVAPCRGKAKEYDDYGDPIIEHGLITWYEGEIYYTPYIAPKDPKENNSEYKANLMLPTTIMELGSMNYCDVDDVPFIMDQLEPTTFQVSYEEFKYKGKPNGSFTDPNTGFSGNLIEVLKMKDKKDSSLNLRAYVEFGCASVVCANIMAAVNQSQIGVEIVDKNDLGIEAGNCFVRFDHDEDIRSYFCRRFNGYKSDRSFHHSRPGGVDTDNIYNTYPEITVEEGTPTYYKLLDNGGTILSEFNDGDSFISGDACGYKDNSGNADYFYGLAPGLTGQFIDYPNGSSTLNFGTTPVVDKVDDNINFVTNVSGVRFNRSQTPYHLYFGLVPGKTALHKTVSKFFADKINSVTLQGLGKSNNSVSETINNKPNIDGGTDNKFTVYKTCLGESLIEKVKVP